MLERGLFKTLFFMAILTGIFAFVGFAIGGQGGMLTALGFAAVMNLFSYWNADKIVLAMYKARPIEAGEYPQLASLIQRLAERAQIPTPRAYIIPSEQPNAFATGRNPEKGVVAVTEGIMNILDERELAGVIAHEMAHIKHRDTLTMTVTSTIAGAISMLGNFAFFFGGRDSNGERSHGAIFGLVAALLAPFAAMLVQMAISRTREYAADAEGAAISGDPLALASALAKLDDYSHKRIFQQAEENPASANLFIVNPIGARTTDSLFTTHPATANRIAELEKLAQDPEITALPPVVELSGTNTARPSISPWGKQAGGKKGPWG